ncbi:hypothetical protein HGA64_01535 [Candidatus Falkowbacteria bacterium]|nr:hypothetical protein [Candidatus Falkowbacteria bacterium]
MIKGVKILERVYFGLLVLIMGLVLFNHYFVSGRFDREALVSTVITAGLMAVAYIVYTLYKREVMRNLEELEGLRRNKQDLEGKIDEAFKYIGQLNVQIEEIRTIFSGVKKLPESKSELRVILDFLSSKVLSVAGSSWTCLKIVDLANYRILAEHTKTRGESEHDVQAMKADVSARMLIANSLPKEYCIVRSAHDNLDFAVYCLLPSCDLSKEQKVFIRAVVNQLEMFYLIFTNLSSQRSEANKKNNN